MQRHTSSTCAGPASRSTGRRPATRGPGSCGGSPTVEAEFLTFSFWESKEAIRGFTGGDVEPAVFYPKDDRYLGERDTTVRHFQVTAE